MLRIEPRLLDFLVIGAPKAGTTTLAADLARHPQLWLPRRKELGYFDVRWNREPLEAYLAEFAPAPAGRKLGEATPTYLHHPGAIERIAEAMPAVRLVAMLRDPVARFWSHYWYNCAARRVEQRPPGVVVDESPEAYLEPGAYARHLRRVLRHFPQDQLHVVLLDDLASDPAGVFRAVCRHLGVAEEVPADVGRTRNRAYALRSPLLRRQMVRFALWRRLPLGIGFRLDEWNRAPFDPPDMPDDLRAVVTDWYQNDTAELAELLGRPLPWTPRSEADRSGDRPR